MIVLPIQMITFLKERKIELKIVWGGWGNRIVVYPEIAHCGQIFKCLLCPSHCTLITHNVTHVQSNALNDHFDCLTKWAGNQCEGFD